MKIRVRNLNKSYHLHPVLALQEAEFGAYELEGLIGPNGAGKSTLMGLLTQRIPPTSGNIWFDIDGHEHNLRTMRVHEVARLGLVKTNQRIQGFESLSIRDSLRLAATAHSQETLRGVLDKNQIDDDIESEIDHYLSLFSFSNPNGYALSGGEKKLLDILRCLVLKPRMLLMDEPTAGLPDDITQQVMRLVVEKARAQQMRVLIVEHDLELIWSFCDYVHFLSDGEMLFQGTPENVKKNRVVAEKYMGV